MKGLVVTMWFSHDFKCNPFIIFSKTISKPTLERSLSLFFNLFFTFYTTSYWLKANQLFQACHAFVTNTQCNTGSVKAYPNLPISIQAEFIWGEPRPTVYQRWKNLFCYEYRGKVKMMNMKGRYFSQSAAWSPCVAAERKEIKSKVCREREWGEANW